MEAVYTLTGAILFGTGLYGVFAHRHLVRKVIAANITTSAVFLILIATTRTEGQVATDPVPQALVLTGIVIAVSVTAFALVLIRQFVDLTGTADLDEER